VSLGQLLFLGLSKQAVYKRVRAGRLHRVHVGVYAVGQGRLSRDGRELAAVLACGPEAMLSHRSAAERWEIMRSAFGLIEVTATRSRRRKTGILVHTSRVLPPEDRTVMDGIPVTSLGRTIVDLAEVSSDRRLGAAIHQAEVRGLFDLSEVEAALGRVPGRRGRHRLYRVLAMYRPAEHEFESGNERRLAEICRAYGLPETRPALIGPYRVDCYWADAGIVIEVDGTAVHNTRKAFHEDRARDRALAVQGIQVLRVTEPDLGRPAAIAAELHAVRRTRAGSRAA
jgi:very-short-patch-repair endonuclease